MNCEYLDCDRLAYWTVIECYSYRDDGTFNDVKGLNVCKHHRPGHLDPNMLWNSKRAHGIRKIGDLDPCFTWTDGQRQEVREDLVLHSERECIELFMLPTEELEKRLASLNSLTVAEEIEENAWEREEIIDYLTRRWLFNEAEYKYDHNIDV